MNPLNQLDLPDSNEPFSIPSHLVDSHAVMPRLLRACFRIIDRFERKFECLATVVFSYVCCFHSLLLVSKNQRVQEVFDLAEAQGLPTDIWDDSVVGHWVAVCSRWFVKECIGFEVALRHWSVDDFWDQDFMVYVVFQAFDIEEGEGEASSFQIKVDKARVRALLFGIDLGRAEDFSFYGRHSTFGISFDYVSIEQLLRGQHVHFDIWMLSLDF